jgi:hypothetical protein
MFLNVISSLSACAGPVTYSAEPTEAKIIDAETKQPVEGVVVVAHWVLEGGLHLDRVGDLVILETITDKQGKFHFPAWGPIRHWKNSRLTYMDPRILIFKSGYEYQVLSNRLTTAALKGEGGPVRRSDWNGKTIALKPFKGTVEEYAEHVYNLDNEMRFARYGNDCEWKKVPHMLVELHRLSKQFDSKDIKVRGWQIGARIRKVTDVDNQDRCGPAEEFFKSYLP